MNNAVLKAVVDDPLLGVVEKDAILTVLKAGNMYGYGNMMAWLATAWACHLRDEWALKEATAIEAVSGRGPYPLPPPVIDA
jgi:hypothetical protein